mmetsp:Transcript_17499/g.42181  ORF Transcript_17499/g.42181 Transcript_17499/m.42181 type:complete len:232 (-) Transcript_17499:1341-2036(-)
MRIGLWRGFWLLRVGIALIYLVRTALQHQQEPGTHHAPCQPFACEDHDGECWERLREYAAAGKGFANRGNIPAALECFTLAANAVRDERWLQRPEKLLVRQKKILSFLYTTAAGAMLRAGVPQAQLRQWQRRAAHISAPSVSILFDEEGAAANPRPAVVQSVTCDGNVLMREGRWSESVACFAEVVWAWARGSGSSRLEASEALHAMGTSLYRLKDDANSLRALHAAFRLR